MGPVTHLGHAVVQRWERTRDVTALVYLAGKASVIERGRGRQLVRRIVRQQILFTGIQALPLITGIAVLTGALLGLLIAVVERHQNLTAFAPFTQTLFTELTVTVIAPLILALTIIARSGTAIATELANMRINREIDALEAMGINLHYFVIFPRLVGMVVSLVCLTVYFNAISVSVELLILTLAGTAMPFADLMRGASFLNFVQAGIKLGIIGVGIAAISCHAGLSARSSYTEVPQVAARGVVGCIRFTWAAIFAISVLFLMWFPPVFARMSLN